MKYGIRHQESYSRGELLLRTFFGVLYMALPHMLVLIFLALGSAIINFIAFWAILFTGKYPKGMFDYQVKFQRWNLRLSARLSNLSDGYPAFGLDAKDPNIVLEIPYTGSSNRGTVLLRMFFGIIYVMIPHAICLIFLQIGAMFVNLIAFWVILITGKYPVGMHGYMVGVMRWAFRVNAYMGYLTDVYPPFSMEETDKIDWSNTTGVEDHLVG